MIDILAGGAFQLITLSRLLHSMVPRTGGNLRLATIIDSAPGSGEYSSLLATLTANVESPAAKVILTVPVSLFYLGLRLRRSANDSSVLGQENLFTLLHSCLQMEELLPLADGNAPRLYIYSSTDRMVSMASVEKHISALRMSSHFSDIGVEKFSGSGHVLHERHDPVRYWNVVQAVWERSLFIRAKL
ncbi:hypothetical protein B0H11DRAFT_1716114 [Mycena galericulata]|nr:hypothetical protein B0H11DRAFT_1716114 [Mycena galericulata]